MGIIFIIFSIFFITYDGLIKVSIEKLSIIRETTENNKISSIQKTFLAFREVKLFHLENTFFNKYKIINKASVEPSIKIHLIQQYPKLALEFFAILLMIGLIIFVLTTNKEFSKFTPFLAVLSMVIFKILPASSRLISAIQNLRYITPILKKIISNFSSPNFISGLSKKSISQVRLSGSLIVKNFSCSRENGDVLINNSFIKLKLGEVAVLTGDSGSGKSSLLNCIAGLEKKYKGKIYIGATLIDRIVPNPKLLGYVTQEMHLIEGTILENIL
jgi:ABC-type bacteriocin/lantibiotic exporter with double-glycine peptidase domain